MALEQTENRVGFIGAGRMATALARGLISSDFSSAASVTASDISSASLEHFVSETGARGVASNSDVFSESNIVVLAVKPQQISDVLTEVQHSATSEHLIISIAAGVPISVLTRTLGEDRRIVRVMPNTPCLVGAAASAFAIGGAATADDARAVTELLTTVGIAVEVSEDLLDAVTGLSGSGPAYVFQMIEALSDGGVRMGLPRHVATQLATQTVLGAARMVLETGEHPGVLKDAVTSPGGTTIAGLHALEKGGFRVCLIDAVQKATERSRELGESS